MCFGIEIWFFGSSVMEVEDYPLFDVFFLCGVCMVGNTISYFLIARLMSGAIFDALVHPIASSIAFIIFNFNVIFTSINYTFSRINIVCRLLSKRFRVNGEIGTSEEKKFQSKINLTHLDGVISKRRVVLWATCLSLGKLNLDRKTVKLPYLI